MPLSALANGAVVIAPLVSQAAWDGLAASVRRGETELVIGACGHPARMRRSKLGTQHFFHRRPEACGTAPESPAHLQAKAQIVLGCQAAGWDVETEARGADWRADVLASRGRHRVAFEVQLSRQSWEETVARTKRYEQSGIRACWLLRHYPMKTPVTKEIPAFHIVRRDIVPDRTSPFGKESVGDVPGYVACIEGHTRVWTLPRFAEMLLQGRVRFSATSTGASRQTVRILFPQVRCWKCQALNHIWRLADDFQTECGQSLSSSGVREELLPGVQELVSEFRQTPEASNLRIGQVALRYSKAVRGSYLSFGCFSCGVLFRQFFIDHEEGIRARQAFVYGTYKGLVYEKQIDIDRRYIQSVKHPHWCVSDSGRFCYDVRAIAMRHKDMRDAVNPVGRQNASRPQAARS